MYLLRFISSLTVLLPVLPRAVSSLAGLQLALLQVPLLFLHLQYHSKSYFFAYSTIL
jgi:hypothetical protein